MARPLAQSRARAGRRPRAPECCPRSATARPARSPPPAQRASCRLRRAGTRRERRVRRVHVWGRAGPRWRLESIPLVRRARAGSGLAALRIDLVRGARARCVGGLSPQAPP
eukprot:7383643-Prymnesium_polylepis.1